MAVLLLGEVTNGELSRDATAKAVGALKSLGEVTVLCAGAQARAAGDEAATIDGVARVLVAEDALYGHRLAEPAAALLVFVDVMKELPATIILRPFNFDTLAVRAHSLASDERLAEASTASLTIVVVGILPVILLSLAMRRARPGSQAE